MRVKRYVVDSMPDALQKIRTDLGKDAVILNTKDIKVGGFLGFFSRKCIEVIAATDTNAAPTAAKPSVKSYADGPIGDTRQSAVQTQAKQIVAPIETVSSASVPIAAPNLYQAPSRSGSKQADSSDKDSELVKEMRQMKELLQRFSKNSGIAMLQEELRPIELKLLEHEIHPELVERIITEANQQLNQLSDQWSKEDAIAVVRELLLSMIRSNAPKTLQNETKIVHFVGPTGVGKTTTIAKLAAEQVLKFNRKVGFITSDTYRIAAIEQLKTYANILNVPLEVVFSPQEMTRALHNFAELDIIFMDTAGRNYRNELYVSELNALLKSNGQCETYLVLSLTSKYRDIKLITENFSKFRIDKVLFTKMDETETLGAIVNLAHDYNLRGSYVTYGQNVPDDIEVLREERIVDMILGGRDHD